MRFFSLIKLPVVLVLAALLSACGFHLRGEYTVPEELHTMSFTSYDEYNQLTRYVRSQLKLNKVQLIQPSSNVPNLHLIESTLKERTLSLYQNSRAAEKELTYTVQYRVTIPGHGSKNYTTTVNRNYLDNPLTALAKSVERDVIKDEMHLQAAKQMMRQLGRVRAEYESGEIDELTTNTNS